MKFRSAIFKAVTAMMVLTVVGCGDKTDLAGDNQAETMQEGKASQTESAKIGVIFTETGLGDKNFNDMVYAGVMQAQEELGIDFDYVEPNAISDMVPLSRQFAETEEYDLIITVGNSQEESTAEIASEFPNQKISLIDSAVEIPGVSSIQTEWTEQTFLAGVIAGLGTLSDMEKANSENIIGVILGRDQPSLRNGVVGFTAGAKYVNPDVEILEGVVGEFNDPGKGKEIALSMYNKGADFIQHLAGGSGLGVYGAAKETNHYAFGVGTNQNGEEPDYIVASSVRYVAQMAYSEIEKLVEGTWEAGLHMSGIKEGAVGCTTEGSNIVLPKDIQQAVDDITSKLQSGELTVCRNAEELDSWLAENHYNGN